MDRLTHPRCSGIKEGYWSPAKKEELVQRLAAWESPARPFTTGWFMATFPNPSWKKWQKCLTAPLIICSSATSDTRRYRFT